MIVYLVVSWQHLFPIGAPRPMDDLPLSFNYMGLLPFIIRDHVCQGCHSQSRCSKSLDANVMGIHGNEKEIWAAER